MSFHGDLRGTATPVYRLARGVNEPTGASVFAQLFTELLSHLSNLKKSLAPDSVLSGAGRPSAVSIWITSSPRNHCKRKVCGGKRERLDRAACRELHPRILYRGIEAYAAGTKTLMMPDRQTELPHSTHPKKVNSNVSRSYGINPPLVHSSWGGNGETIGKYVGGH